MKRFLFALALSALAAGCGGGTKEITDRRGCNPKDITTNNCVEVMR
jgi:hypothetical protein